MAAADLVFATYVVQLTPLDYSTAMTRRQRLMATLRGDSVDRPAVSFYEIGGLPANPDDPDPFNIHNDPSWRELLALAEQKTDLIRMRAPSTRPRHPESLKDLRKHEVWTEESADGQSRFERTTIRIGRRTLTSVTRRDAAIDTIWVIEHLLKGPEDLLAYLELPDEYLAEEIECANLRVEDERVGENGIVMVDTADPLCLAASLFSMEDYTTIAFTDPALFHRLLDKFSRPIHQRTKIVAEQFPGHLWRIYGPEYASEPYLPPALFDEYVLRYVEPMVRMIHGHGGFARIHCHGRVRNILPKLVRMGAAGTDPIEPPHQGDITLAEARAMVGKDLALFGNLEASDIENRPPAQFEQIVRRSLAEGTAGSGRGFVLMPSACPYGRKITPTTLANYQTMVRLVEAMA
jgi:hypothetical protein